ncbi:MAG: hypothetical protein RL193_668 [Actinomycetota bacterium]|jgi:Spy/CpxP family protein refolding chaperone
MKNRKKIVGVVITALAITGTATALANATDAKQGLNKLANHIHMKDGHRGPKGGPKDGGFKHADKEAVVTATLGIDATTLRSRLAAGESLAAIAGAKKDALIAALVAEETKQIDAAVTAGKLTAAQATTLKSNLTAHITAEVNEAGHMGRKGGPMGGKDGKGGRGHHGGHHGEGKGIPSGATNGIPNTSGTNN